MNLSASSIPSPVSYQQSFGRLTSTRIPELENGEKCALLARQTRKVAFYVRSATVERTKTDEQLPLLFDFTMKQNGWIATTCFIDWGSGLEKGAGLSAMIDAMASSSRGFDLILVTAWSRISRNIHILDKIRETANRSGVTVLSLSDVQAPRSSIPQATYDTLSGYDRSETCGQH